MSCKRKSDETQENDDDDEQAQLAAIRSACLDLLDYAPALFSTDAIRAHLLAQGYIATAEDVTRAFHLLYAQLVGIKVPDDFVLTIVRKEDIPHGNP